MKKIVSLLLVAIILISFSLTSCSNDEYELVHSITYTLDGKSYTLTSSYIIGRDSGIECSQQEYFLAKHRFDSSIIQIRKHHLPENSKTVQSYGSLTNDNIGEYFYVEFIHYNSPNYIKYYKKYKFTGIGYLYVYVKVIDDDTIEITHDGKKTTYNVSSYSITYFDTKK